jgi:hypothetical protein
VTGAGHRTFFHPLGRRGTFCTLLKRWQAWVKITSTLGSHVSCPAQNLVKFDDVLIGSKLSFCETVVIFDLVHDDDLAKQALFGASGIHIFNVDFSWCAQYLLTFQHVLPQPSCHFVRVRSLLLSLGANFDIARGHSRNRVGLISADSQRFWQRDLVGSVRGPSYEDLARIS